MARAGLQARRMWTQVGFFVLFIMAPPLDLLRVDLDRGHAYLLTLEWTLGIDSYIAGDIGMVEAAFNLFWRGFLPIFGGAMLFIWLAWRYGRLYCGWLCPHFSVVELINGLMIRASGKPSLWEKKPLPVVQPDGTEREPHDRYWLLVAIAVPGFAFLWAVVLLTYLISPMEIYSNLFSGSLTRNQFTFIAAATIALSIEFLLARHLFCRFGCAVGLFQSIAWMANDRAMVVGFDTRRARECGDCNKACENACPMRLKPRTLKRAMFTCTECSQCIQACQGVKAKAPKGSLLSWVSGEAAKAVVTGRGPKD